MFTRIDHVALHVSDLSRSVAFYERHFGFEAYNTHDVPNGPHIAYLRKGGTILELVGRGEPISGFHFCLGTDDFDAAVAGLEKAGLEVFPAAPPGAAARAGRGELAPRRVLRSRPRADRDPGPVQGEGERGGMIKTIVVATDGSGHAQKALKLACDLANKYRARIVLVHVLLRDAPAGDLRRLANMRKLTKAQRDLLEAFEAEPQMAMAAAGVGGAYIPIPPPHELLEPIGRQVLDRAEASARKQTASRVTKVMVSGDAADAIVAEAKKAKADMIVMGSRGFGDLRGLLLGSVSHKVAAHADCTVLTVK